MEPIHLVRSDDMPEQTVDLGWGTGKITLTLPERLRARVAAPQHAPALREVEAGIASALRNPAGKSLEEVCRGLARVLVVVSDRTRVTGVREYLPLLVEFLLDCGVREQDIEVIVATGMHSPGGAKHFAEFLPVKTVDRLRISEHDCRDSASHFYAGRTSRGTEVHLNRKVAETDLVILTGSIGFHYFAGFRGGRKSVLPGVASFDTISANHRLTIQGEKGFHPLCRNASLEGNPVHEDMQESLKMIPTSFLLNTIVNGEGQILNVFAGDPVEAHLKGCQEFSVRASVDVSEKAGCAIVSCGGYPKDWTLIQSHKAVENASSALEDGGSMVVLAKCEGGVGSDTLLDWFSETGPDEVRRKLVTNYTLHGHTALSAMEKAARYVIYLVSDLSDETVRSAGLIPVSSAGEALSDILARKKGDVTTLVFPEGAETLPVVRR
jgi:nickel-dependent lactate racemase